MNNIEWYIIGAAIAIFIFKWGVSSAKAEREGGIKGQAQRDEDLGLLAPALSQWASGDLTREEADQEVRSITVFDKSAKDLWFTMADGERAELGKHALTLFADPDFQARQGKLIEGLKAADPELWNQAKEAIQAKDAAREANRSTAEDELFRDLMQLKSTDPDAYEEAVDAIMRRASGED